jgi:hypothetical protein
MNTAARSVADRLKPSLPRRSSGTAGVAAAQPRVQDERSFCQESEEWMMTVATWTRGVIAAFGPLLTNLNLTRRGAPGSGCQASSFCKNEDSITTSTSPRTHVH